MAVLLSHADPDDLKLQTSAGESLLHLAISEVPGLLQLTEYFAFCLSLI